MEVASSELKDFNAWIALVKEVEHLFGPMADEASFQDGLQQAIFHKNKCNRASVSRADYQDNPSSDSSD